MALDYSRDEHGEYRCGICVFSTPHEVRIVNHMVKSHDQERPAPPPLELATPKGRKLAEARKLQEAKGKGQRETASVKAAETAVLQEPATKTAGTTAEKASSASQKASKKK